MAMLASLFCHEGTRHDETSLYDTSNGFTYPQLSLVAAVGGMHIMERHSRVTGIGGRIPKTLAGVQRRHKRVGVDCNLVRTCSEAVKGNKLTAAHEEEEAYVNERVWKGNDSDERHACANTVRVC